MKILIVYDSKYGNTKRVAHHIKEGLNNSRTDAEISYVKDVDNQKISECDVLVLGAPNHMGGPSRTMKKFIDGLADISMKGDKVALFDTYFMRPKNHGKALGKMEKRLREKRADLKLLIEGLSVKVEGIRGPIAQGELSKCKEFGSKIISQLA